MCKDYQAIKAMKEKERQAFLHETAENNSHLISGEIYLSILDDDTIDSISKWYAIKAIGEMKDVKNIPVLIEVLKKQNVFFGKTSLHLIASCSLGKIGAPAVPFVLSLLDKNFSTETQIAAVDALGEIGSVEVIPVLIEIIESKPNNIALWAGLSLSKIGVPTVKEQIRIYDSLSNEKQIIILDSLMRIHDASALEFVAKQFYRNEGFYNAFRKAQGDNFIHFMNTLKENNSMMYKLLEG